MIPIFLCPSDLHVPNPHRLPLPVVPGWMILAVDLDQILAEYCTSPTPGARSAVPQLQTLKVRKPASNHHCGRALLAVLPFPSLRGAHPPAFDVTLLFASDRCIFVRA
jgi:hypothetical protein